MGWPGCLGLILHPLLPKQECHEVPRCSAAPTLPSSFPGAGPPSQGMESHQCWEPGLNHTQELRTRARVQGLRESPHPSVTALTAGKAAVAPETQVSCRSPATTRPGGLREGCRRSMLCCWSFSPSLVGPGAGKLTWVCEQLEPASRCLLPPEETRSELHSSEDLEIPRCLSGLTVPTLPARP